MTKYTQSMAEAYQKVLLREDNMDLMKKAAGGAMQTIKLKDGKLKMDSFTASAIMGVYDKVNPANQKKIETIINRGNKTSILKLQSMAMKAIKSGDELEHDGEELDESVSVKDFDALKKGDTITLDYKSAMSSGKGTFTVTAKNKVAKGKVEKVTLKSVKNPGGVKHFLYKRDDKVSFAQGDMGASVVSFKKEEVELDEASVMVDLENDNKKLMSDIKKMGIKVKDLGDSGNPGYNEYKLTGSPAALKKGGKKFGWDQQVNEWSKKKVKEEDDDEEDDPKKKKKTDTGEKPDEIDLNPDVEEGKKK